MNDDAEAIKQILGETVKAFQSGLKGEEYENPLTEDHEPAARIDEEPAQPDPYNAVAKLHELKLAGAISEDEYQREKARLLGDR